MGREESGNASIPAPGDGAEVKGGAAPGPRGGEAPGDSRRVEESAAATEEGGGKPGPLKRYFGEYVDGRVRLLRIEVDYVYDVRGDVLVKVSHHPTPTPTTRIGWLELARGLSLRQAYGYVARDVQDMAQHIADRAEELAKTTLEYLRALKRKEVAVRYPEAIILEGMPWFKDEPADGEVL